MVAYNFFTILPYVSFHSLKMLTPNMNLSKNKNMKKKTLVWKQHKKHSSPRLSELRRENQIDELFKQVTFENGFSIKSSSTCFSSADAD